MKILYLVHQFYPKFYTGTERVVLNTALYMKKLGHDVTVFTYSYDENGSYENEENGILWKEYHYEGIHVIAFKDIENRVNDGYIHEDHLKFYVDILNEIKPDIIHAGHLMRVASILSVAIERKIPYVLNLTDFWLICHKAQMITDSNSLCSGPDKGKKCKELCMGLEKKYYEKRFEIAKNILEKSSANIVSSEFLTGIFLSSLENFEYEYIPYGLNFSYLSQNTKVYSKDSKINILFAGTLSKHKGINVLIEAFKIANRNNLILNIYGKGPLEDYVRKETDNQNNMNYYGIYNKDKTKEIINGNDVVVIPSTWYENNPIILQEMIAGNIPPIVSSIGSLPEMVENNKTGFTFEVKNIKKLAAILQKISDNPEELNKIKKNMFLNYGITTIEQQCLNYEKLYKKSNSL